MARPFTRAPRHTTYNCSCSEPSASYCPSPSTRGAVTPATSSFKRCCSTCASSIWSTFARIWWSSFSSTTGSECPRWSPLSRGMQLAPFCSRQMVSWGFLARPSTMRSWRRIFWRTHSTRTRFWYRRRICCWRVAACRSRAPTPRLTCSITMPSCWLKYWYGCPIRWRSCVLARALKVVGVWVASFGRGGIFYLLGQMALLKSWKRSSWSSMLDLKKKCL